MRCGPDITICDGCYERLGDEGKTPISMVTVLGVPMHVCDDKCYEKASQRRASQLAEQAQREGQMIGKEVPIRRDSVDESLAELARQAKKLRLVTTSKSRDKIDLEKRHGW